MLKTTAETKIPQNKTTDYLGSELAENKVPDTAKTEEKEPLEKEEPVTEATEEISLALLKKSIVTYLEENDSHIDIMAKNTLKNDFTFEDDTITFTLTNPLEKDKIEAEKAGLLKFLRSTFKNTKLHLDYDVNVQAKASRPYTPKEKFEAMMEKHPILSQLKDKLGLDTDY